MRVDASRNREAVLAAAGRLFDAAQEPDQVSMDDIAAAAGVGKGTLFRRFGDRTGLIRALYEQRGTDLRTTLADPASPAVERALALLDAALLFKVANRALGLALETAGSGSPYRNESYDQWHTTLVDLVTEARGTRDADYLAHALLAAVRSDLVEHLRDRPAVEIRAGLATLVRAVMGQSDGRLADDGDPIRSSRADG